MQPMHYLLCSDDGYPLLWNMRAFALDARLYDEL